jgi:hypothetical protein
MWATVFLVIITVVLIIWKFRRGGSLDGGRFTARVSGYLFDLGLDVRHLPHRSKEKFFQEADALHIATNGSFNPKRLAIRFFSWYCVENPDFNSRPLLREGVIGSSIPLMRSWAAAEPELANMVEKEVDSIVRFLYKGIEKADADKETKLSAQLALLKLAATNNK